jgi:dihydrofolate reductase
VAGLVGAEPPVPHAHLRPDPPLPTPDGDGGRHDVHFLDASPAQALATAREAAGGLDVRIGGGPSVVREFLQAGLVDHMHLVQVPIVLGRGVRLWDGLEGLDADYDVETVSSPSGVTHLTFTRTAPGAAPTTETPAE